MANVYRARVGCMNKVVMLQVPLLCYKMASSIKINYKIFFEYNET